MGLEYIGGNLFKSIEIDERVTPDLEHCLYCKVTSQDKSNRIRDTSYKISLFGNKGDRLRQCPACNRIYVLFDKFDQK